MRRTSDTRLNLTRTRRSVMTSTLSRSQTTPADHSIARRSLSIGKTIEDSAAPTWWTCQKCSRSIRLSRSASGAFRTPRVVKLPLWENKLSSCYQALCLGLERTCVLAYMLCQRWWGRTTKKLKKLYIAQWLITEE